MSWLRNDVARSLVALTAANVIRQLGDLSAAAEGEPPMLSVHLASGQVLDGALMRVDGDRGTDVLVLADLKMGRLAYAPLAHVAAVELRNPEPFSDVHHAGARLAIVPAPDGLAVRADLSAALPRALSEEFFKKISALL